MSLQGGKWRSQGHAHLISFLSSCWGLSSWETRLHSGEQRVRSSVDGQREAGGTSSSYQPNTVVLQVYSTHVCQSPETVLPTNWVCMPDGTDLNKDRLLNRGRRDFRMGLTTRLPTTVGVKRRRKKAWHVWKMALRGWEKKSDALKR